MLPVLAAQMAGVKYLIEVFFAEAEGLQGEKGMGVEVVAEGIEIRDQVSQIAVRENQADDLRLVGSTLGRNCACRSCREVETGKEQPPLVAHRGGVLLPLLVHLLDVVGARE